MSDKHMHFEVLCTLAACRSLAHRELRELRTHVDRCPACEEHLLQIEAIREEVFLVRALSESPRGTPKGMSERFVERAVLEGMELRPHTARMNALYAPMLLSFALLLLAVSFASNGRSSLWKTTPPAGPSQALLSTDGARHDLITSQSGLASRGAHHSLTISSRPRIDGARRNHGEPTVGEATRAAAGHPDSEIRFESTTARPVFVMYSPKPKFSSESIPSLVMTWAGHDLEPSHPGQPVGFEYAFALPVQKPLLEASSDSPQQLNQHAYDPIGKMNFRFNPSDFPERQTTTH